MTGRAAAIAVSVGLATAIVHAQNPSFSSKIEAVRVDVLVTERDSAQPIMGLTADDFEITDNGVKQKVDLVSFEQIPLNVILALDMSDSVAGDRLEHLRGAGGGLLNALKTGDQASLVTFSHQVVRPAPLTTNVRPVRQALDQVSGSGGTALADAIYSGLMIGESDAGRGLLIVFSDGLDTSSWLTADQVLDTARRSDVVVYGVSVQSNIKPEFLRDLTHVTGGRLYEIEKTANLSAVFLSVLEEFRNRYLVSYTPAGVAAKGYHRLDVNVRGRRVAVKARPGYLAGS